MFWKLMTVFNENFIPIFFEKRISKFLCNYSHIIIKNNHLKKTIWNNTDNNNLQHLAFWCFLQYFEGNCF